MELWVKFYEVKFDTEFFEDGFIFDWMMGRILWNKIWHWIFQNHNKWFWLYDGWNFM